MNKKINSITIKYQKNIDWKKSFEDKLKMETCQSIQIDCIDMLFTCKDIEFIKNLLKFYNLDLERIRSNNPKTIVSCQSTYIKSELILEKNKIYSENIIEPIRNNQNCSKAYFHQGTLRSGELLDINNDLIVLGDVNPGAIIKATGNIMIWGRLLGTAHAGKKGDASKKIGALQLRPVQLRIADKIARGPEEQAIAGFAEEARIESETIIISPITTFQSKS